MVIGHKSHSGTSRLGSGSGCGLGGHLGASSLNSPGTGIGSCRVVPDAGMPPAPVLFGLGLVLDRGRWEVSSVGPIIAYQGSIRIMVSVWPSDKKDGGSQ